MLEASHTSTSKQHIAGATTIARLRGPHGYKTDFEKSLLVSLIGPVVRLVYYVFINSSLTQLKYTEAVIRGTDCFLAQEPWKDTLRSAVLETNTFSDCSNIILSLWLTIIDIPRLFNAVEAVVYQSPTALAATVISLLQRLTQLRIRLKVWRTSYAILESANANQHTTREQLSTRFDRRCEALGLCLANQMIVNRLVLALDCNLVSSIEDETQNLAKEFTELGNMSRETNPRAFLFIMFKQMVVLSVQHTEHNWRAQGPETYIEGSDRYNIISWNVFRDWVKIQGRTSEILGKDESMSGKFRITP